MNRVVVVVVQISHVGFAGYQVPEQFCDDLEYLDSFLGGTHVEFLGTAKNHAFRGVLEEFRTVFRDGAEVRV